MWLLKWILLHFSIFSILKMLISLNQCELNCEKIYKWHLFEIKVYFNINNWKGYLINLTKFDNKKQN